MADTKSTLSKALEYKAKYEALLNEAKDEALVAIREQVKELNNLGFNYELVQAGGSRPSRVKSPGQRVCRICNEPGHNSRTCPKKPA